MSGFKNDNMSRISFFFDKIPEFKIEDSGQRVRVVLAQTSFDRSFIKMPPDEVVFHIETNENVQESVIEFYCRNIPKFVDVTVDKQNARLDVNIFWDHKRLGGRPAILDQRLGEVKTSMDGSTAQKVVSSQYSGRWIDFFREFEWPVNLSLPINFTLPRIPSPLVVDNSESLPQELLQEGTISLCEEAAKRLTDLMVENTEAKDIGLHGLIVAECFLRKKDSRQAMDVLDRVGEKISDESLIEWKRYYRSYAWAISGKYYQAANLLAGWEERCRNINGPAPWCLILQSELELAKEMPGQVPVLLSAETEIDDHLAWLYNLRKTDALYQLGRFDDAYAGYQNVVLDLLLLQQHPYSLGNWADVLYKKKEYSEAYRHYNLLSEGLKNESSHQRALVDYLSAMALLRSGDQERARLMFTETIKNDDKSEAGLRSWVKLIDLDLLSDSRPELNRVLSEYNEIIKSGSVRNLREEAFFKQILTCHLYGDDLRAVKLLGRFFEDYWAGNLQSEAQALFVEIFPQVVEDLVAQDSSFLALSLVAKHRSLLAQARITYGFLYNLAKSYSQAGFFEQAETTYLFMLDFEKNTENKRNVFLPLIQVFYQQKKYEHVQKYASQYLKDYPEGADRSEVLYHYADVLYKNGDVGTAVTLLIDKNRPKTKELDILTGDIFFELGKYDLVEYYLSRVATEVGKDKDPEITMKRAEALFFAQKWQNAIPLYESLLEKPQFRGQAGYRLILIYYELGQKKRALKLYNQLAETETENQWLKLAGETIQTGNSITKEN
jgi:tetratricopeptide (TPR) repeat protein